jgi:hypothetical protein
VRNEVADSALVELMAQLRRVAAEPVPAAELENAKGALVGVFPLSVETAQQIAEQVAAVKTLGLPADYLQTYRTRIAAVTAADVQRSAQAYVRPAQALVVVVGDAAALYDRLAKIGPVRVTDIEGNTVAAASATAPPAAAPLALDFSKLVARRDSFTVLAQGNPLGATVLHVQRRPGGWSLVDTTVIAGGVVRQYTALETDASLAPRTLTQTGSLQGQAVNTSVTYAGGRAKGTSARPTPQGVQPVTVDAAVPAGTLDFNALQAALPLMRWAPNARLTVPVFESARNAVVPITLTVAGSESVTVPAGTFMAYRVEATGGQAPVTFFVTTDAAHRVVKIAFAGQPIEAVLAK